MSSLSSVRNQRHKRGGYYGSLWVINTNGDSVGLRHLNANKKIECYCGEIVGLVGHGDKIVL